MPVKRAQLIVTIGVELRGDWVHDGAAELCQFLGPKQVFRIVPHWGYASGVRNSSTGQRAVHPDQKRRLIEWPHQETVRSVGGVPRLRIPLRGRLGT